MFTVLFAFKFLCKFGVYLQLLVAGQPTTGTSPPLGASASSLSPGSSTAGVAPGAVSPSGAATQGSAAGGTSCCENGRPIMTDPVSGQTVCSCQYDPARLTLSYPRLSTSGVGVYGTPYPSTDQNPYPSIGVDSSAFYSPLVSSRSLSPSGHLATGDRLCFCRLAAQNLLLSHHVRTIIRINGRKDKAHFLLRAPGDPEELFVLFGQSWSRTSDPPSVA